MLILQSTQTTAAGAGRARGVAMRGLLPALHHASAMEALMDWTPVARLSGFSRGGSALSLSGLACRRRQLARLVLQRLRSV